MEDLGDSLKLLPELEPHVFHCQTIQITPFRKLISSLKDVINDTDMIITPKGMEITTMDKTHTILANVVLYGDQFEHYQCNQKMIVIGIKIKHLNTLVSAAGADDILDIYIESKHYKSGIVTHLGLKIINSKKNQCVTHSLKLIEPSMDGIEYPEIDFPSVIIISSTDFQKIVRDMSALSERVEIKSVGNELHFSVKGKFTDTNMVCSELSNKIEIKASTSHITQGIFSLKSLQMFIRCTNMCPRSELCLKNDIPLVVKYSIQLGFVRLALSQLPPAN